MGASLRQFEFELLHAIGYGVDFYIVQDQAKLIDEHMTYRYRGRKGIYCLLIQDNLTFYGRELLAFDRKEFIEPSVLQAAK